MADLDPVALGILDDNLALRKRMINDLIKERLPNNTDDRMYAIALMDGSDRAALGKLKISILDNQNKIDEQHASHVSEVLKRHRSTSSRVMRERVLNNDFVITDPVSGEMEQGISTETFETFAERLDMNKK